MICSTVLASLTGCPTGHRLWSIFTSTWQVLAKKGRICRIGKSIRIQQPHQKARLGCRFSLFAQNDAPFCSLSLNCLRLKCQVSLLPNLQGLVGVTLPDEPLVLEVIARLIRMTGGNFRLLTRLLTQIERVLDVNQLHSVSTEVIEAARDGCQVETIAKEPYWASALPGILGCRSAA